MAFYLPVQAADFEADMLLRRKVDVRKGQSQTCGLNAPGKPGRRIMITQFDMNTVAEATEIEGVRAALSAETATRRFTHWLCRPV